jgi:hypothetical protein
MAYNARKGHSCPAPKLLSSSHRQTVDFTVQTTRLEDMERQKMNQYRVVISDPRSDVMYGEAFFTTDDDIEAFFWAEEVVVDYSDYYGMFLIGDVTVL